MEIEFNNLNDSHHCTSHVDGDWIVWRCPICLEYERKFNVKTGEMKVKGKTEFRHQGSNFGKSNINKPLTKNINLN